MYITQISHVYADIFYYNYLIMTDRQILEEQFPLNQSLKSNDVVVCQQQQKITYYLPCYVRFLVKQINEIDLEEMEASVSGALIFSFYYGKLFRQSQISCFVGSEEKAIVLEFNKNESISLRQSQTITMKESQNQQTIHFIIRQTFKTFLKGDLFLTPFVVIHLYLQVIAQTVHLNQRQNGKKISIKFNCMDSDSVEILRCGHDLIFGMYRVAPYYFQTKYTNQRSYPFQQQVNCGIEESGHLQVIEDDKQLKNYQFTHFKISIYRFPTTIILTVFLPIWILSAICQYTFFQDKALSNRLATVAVLVLAFVSFVPTINTSIPPSPNIKLVDILMIINLISILLLMIQSYRSQFREEEEFNWNQSNLFKASIALNGFTIIIVLVLFIIHKCCWQPRYKTKPNSNRKIYKKLDKNKWGNRDLDRYLREYAQYAHQHQQNVRNYR